MGDNVTQNVELSAPWEIWRKKAQALLDPDPEITTEWNEETLDLKIRVDNASKAEALQELFPGVVEFGNVKMHVYVIPGNVEMNAEKLFRTAFAGNPLFANATEIGGIGIPRTTYVQFAPVPVQFFADNLRDLCGNLTMLAADAALDVLGEREGVSFCSAPMGGSL